MNSQDHTSTTGTTPVQTGDVLPAGTTPPTKTTIQHQVPDGYSAAHGRAYDQTESHGESTQHEAAHDGSATTNIAPIVQSSGKLLVESESPLVYQPSIANVFGVDRAAFLQQLHYWLQQPKIGKIHLGHKWYYCTLDQWKQQLPHLSLTTIRRMIEEFACKEIVLVGNFNKRKGDQTRWYTINYQRLHEVLAEGKPKSNRGDVARLKKGKIERRAQPHGQKSTSYPTWTNALSNLDRPLPKTSSKTSYTYADATRCVADNCDPESQRQDKDALVTALALLHYGDASDPKAKRKCAWLLSGDHDQTTPGAATGIVGIVAGVLGINVNDVELAYILRNVPDFAEWRSRVHPRSTTGDAEILLAQWREYYEGW